MLKDRLILLRKQKKLSQYDAADRLGFSRGKLANYEQGSREPDYETLKHIANFYDVSIDYLLGRTDIPNNDISKVSEDFDTLYEINVLLKKYGIDQSGFFDIEKWKAMGPEGIKQLESYFQFIVQEAERQKEEKDPNDTFKKNS